MNIAIWIIQGLLAVIFLMAGFMKVSKSKDELKVSGGERMAWVEFSFCQQCPIDRYPGTVGQHRFGSATIDGNSALVDSFSSGWAGLNDDWCDHFACPSG